MSRKNVAYTRPDEPNFIKALKSKVGYKEPSTIGMTSAISSSKPLPQNVTLQIPKKNYRNDPLVIATMMKQEKTKSPLLLC